VLRCSPWGLFLVFVFVDQLLRVLASRRLTIQLIRVRQVVHVRVGEVSVSASAPRLASAAVGVEDEVTRANTRIF